MLSEDWLRVLLWRNRGFIRQSNRERTERLRFRLADFGHGNLKKTEIQFRIYGQKTGTSELETTWKNLYSKPIIRGNHKAGREAVRVLLLAGMREAADLLRTIKVAGYSGRVRVWV